MPLIPVPELYNNPLTLINSVYAGGSIAVKLGNIGLTSSGAGIIQSVTPSDVNGAATWYDTMVSTLFHGTRKDWTRTFGWNMDANGVRPDPTDAAIGDQWESYYEQDATHKWVERHIAFMGTDGTYQRPLSLQVMRTSGMASPLGFTNFTLSADNLSIGGSAIGSTGNFNFLNPAANATGFFLVQNNSQIRLMNNNAPQLMQVNAAGNGTYTLAMVGADNGVYLGDATTTAVVQGINVDLTSHGGFVIARNSALSADGSFADIFNIRDGSQDVVEVSVGWRSTPDPGTGWLEATEFDFFGSLGTYLGGFDYQDRAVGFGSGTTPVFFFWVGAGSRAAGLPGGSDIEMGGGKLNAYFDPSFWADFATSGSHLQSNVLTLNGRYWNGSASVDYPFAITGTMLSTAPAGALAFSFGGTPMFKMDSANIFYSASDNTGQLGFTTGRWAQSHIVNMFTSGIDTEGATTLNVGVTNASDIQIGNGSGTTSILAANVALGTANAVVYLGGNSGASGAGTTATWNDIHLWANGATGGATLKNSAALDLTARYWNGSASADSTWTIRAVMDATTPSSHIEINGGAYAFSFFDYGSMSLAGSVNAGVGFLSSAGQGLDTSTVGSLALGATNAAGIFIGNNANSTTNIQYGKTYTQFYADGGFYFDSTVLASGGAPLINSPTVIYRGKYWNGSVNVTVDNYINTIVTSVAPASYLQFNVQGQAFRMNSAGAIVWPDGTSQSTATVTSGASLRFVSSATTTITNTVTETTLIGSGTGSLTLPANYFTVGKTFRITVLGYFTTPASPDNVTIKLKFGANNLIAKTVSTLTASETSAPFTMTMYIMCAATGASGSLNVSGEMEYPSTTSNPSTRSVLRLNNPGTALTVDTTVSGALNITATYASTTVTNSITAYQVLIEALN